MNTKPKKKSLLDLIEELDKRVSSLEEEEIIHNSKKKKKGKKRKKSSVGNLLKVSRDNLKPGKTPDED